MNQQKIILLLVMTAAILGLDQWTKDYILQKFQHGETVDVIQNYFNITYVRNKGAAFGIFRDLEPQIRNWFFLLMPPVAMSFILYMFHTTPNQDKLRKLSLCAIFAGALGNYVDRVRFQYVVDFLDFHYYDRWVWPAFNVADISIVCGVTVLILLEFQQMMLERKEQRSQ